jgi:hypothetical protein
MQKYFLIFSIIFLSNGCNFVPSLASPIVTGVVAWKSGQAHKYYEFNYHIMRDVVVRSLQELNIEIINEDFFQEKCYKITAGKDDKFKIKISEVKHGICRVSIRINFMGDKEYAELLYKQIDKQTNIIIFSDD